MAEKPRLLFVVTDDWYFVSHRLDLARAAIAAGYHVAVATRVVAHGEPITAAGCVLVPMEWMRRGATPLTELRTLAALRRVYKSFAPDIIHLVALRPVVYGSLVARLVPKALVVNAINGGGYVFSSNGLRARLLRPLLKFALRLALGRKNSRVILQKEEDRALIKGSRSDREASVAVIRGAGVDIDLFTVTPQQAGIPIVVLAARLLWSKGVGDFVEAARLLRAKGITARFALVGDTDAGSYSAISDETLEAWRSEGVVELWGRRSSMQDVFAGVHIVCLPTTYGEGVPKVLIEAAATGRPIVATDVSGCRDIVHDRVTGLLVPPADPQRLADALEMLAEDGALRARFGAAGRRLVEDRFALERVVAETLAFYRT